MSKANNLVNLINAIKKSKTCGCGQKSTSEVILWMMSMLDAFQSVDIGFGKNSKFLREVSSDMARKDLIQIAKEEKYNVHIRPLHALRRIYAEYRGNVPQEILLDIIESGKDREATRMAVIIAMEPLMAQITQILAVVDEAFVIDPTNVVDCGATKVTLICSTPGSYFGRCDEFEVAKAVLQSPIFGRYLAKQEIMEVHDLQDEVERILEFCGVPRWSVILPERKNFGKMKRIAKGLSNNKNDRPSDAVYAILDNIALDVEKAFKALLEIIRSGDDEGAVMVAVHGLFNHRRAPPGNSGIEEMLDFMSALHGKPLQHGIEVIVLNPEEFLKPEE